MLLPYPTFTRRLLFAQRSAWRWGVLCALFAGTTFASQAQAPANDDCATALLLPAGAACATAVVNTTQATASPASLPGGTCSISNTPDVWYRVVVPASGGVAVSTSAAAGSAVTSSILDAYTGTCGTLQFLACDRATNPSGTPVFSSLNLRNLLPGSTVYIRPRVNNSGTVMTGTFNLCVQQLAVSAARPALAGGFLGLYPNPAQHRAILTLPALVGQRTATVTIFNHLGLALRTQEVPLAAGDTTVALDLTTLPTGMYAVHVRAGQEIATVRLLVN